VDFSGIWWRVHEKADNAVIVSAQLVHLSRVWLSFKEMVSWLGR
jgi:hypothetical protein